MSSDKQFLKYWFAGLDNYLGKCDPEDDLFFKETSKACSNSYSAAIYEKAFKKTSDLAESLEALKGAFPDFDYFLTQDGFHILYKTCGCDLVRDFGIENPLLCRCSLYSLEYNLTAVLGGRKFVVNKITTVLEGSDHCEFQVSFTGE